MSDFLGKAKEMAEGLKDKVEDVIHSIEDKLPGHGVDDAKEAVETAADDAKDAVKDVTDHA